MFAPDYYDENIKVKESWRWLDALGQCVAHRHFTWTNLDLLTQACASAIEPLRPIIDAAPNSRFRIKGMKIARSPHRYSGRTSMRANLDEHEPGIPQDADSSFAFSMEGYSGSQQPFQQIPFAWAPGWNSPSAWNKFQAEVGGHLRAGDPGLRLIEPDDVATLCYLGQIPARYSPQQSGFLVVAYQRLFGSEELSQRSAVFTQRMDEACLYLSQSDAEQLGLSQGTKVSFAWDGMTWQLPVAISASLPSGLLGLPLGLSGLPSAMQHAQINTLQEVIS